MSGDLFGVLNDPNGRALTDTERKRLARRQHSVPRGHAWTPGTGPEGETCKTCRHLVRRLYSKAYLKCGKNCEKWTGGPKSDVRASDPACKFWETA